MSLNILIASFVFFFFSYISVSEVLGESTIPLSPTGHEVSGNQWLFVIGINKYSEWPRLNTAVNDARKVKDILLKRYYFDKYHVIELYDEEATRRNILAKLRYLSRRVGPEDSVVVFYSGHGSVGSERREGSWVPVEGSVKDRSSWITNQEIRNYLKIDSIKAKHVLLIVDSCFSGGSFSAYRGRLPRVTDKVIQQAYKEASRQVITTGGIKPVIADGFS
ncbi:MAG: caspase family protein, partial [Planctomycetota bacterium]